MQDIIDSSGVDQWGYSTGGEPGNYGNCLTPITHANLDSLYVWLFNCPTGISNEYAATGTIDVKIYPNPVSDNLTIEAAPQAKIEISNIEGQLIKTIATRAIKQTSDVSAFPGGVYLWK